MLESRMGKNGGLHPRLASRPVEVLQCPRRSGHRAVHLLHVLTQRVFIAAGPVSTFVRDFHPAPQPARRLPQAQDREVTPAEMRPAAQTGVLGLAEPFPPPAGEARSLTPPIRQHG